MRKRSVVFELTDGEIRVFWFSVFPFRKRSHSSTAVMFDRIPIPVGVIEQGNVRNEAVLIEILSAYGAQHPGKAQKAYLAIPLQQGFIRSYTLPWIPKRDRKSAISLLVDQEISIARSDLLFDFLVLSEEKHISIQVLLGATRQSLLEHYVFVFGRAGFKVTGIDFAFSILGQSLEFKPNEDVLYLQGDFDSIQMVLFRGAVPEIIRTLPALSTTKVSVESTKRLIEALGNEIQRFLLYYRTQQTDLNLKRLVWSGDSVAEKLAQELLESDHVTSVEQAKLRCIPGAWRELLDKENGWGEVAAGYGLRISAQGPELNLWRKSNEVQSVLRRYQGIALFACALLMLGTMTWVWLFQATMPLQQEVQQLSNQGARIVAQTKNQKELEVAWKKVKIYPEKLGFGLIQVQALSNTTLTIEHVNYKLGNLSLSGRANAASSVQSLIRTMREMGWEQPALSSYKLTSSNNVEFSLSAKHGPMGMTHNTTENTSTSYDERG